ncbi:tellurite resistance TerB family protein [Falsiroseomonas selenitidurans]|uniref:Tellurite resistance TerB family protein n=1 Tax=Falsiroseomonas selenitidurans TaxID=2716335 RepID=A0ABX1E364_9PROT|nr:tellurite resistance TerB family protein [Falsiroseomonas selenitidurans]NKC31198.1 tellurite resistance TerB family protein [Falsiroseomonas selenitidurans]
MIDAKALLERFLGPQPSHPGAAGGPPERSLPAAPPGASPWGSATGAGGGLAEAARQAVGRAGGLGGMGGFAGGAAAGGLLGLLLGGKKSRGGSLLSHGGAAVLGALAHRAWQNWQTGQAPATAPVATPQDQAEPRFLPAAAPAADGGPFELALIRAMIGAARADGHVDAEERARIFAQVERAGLDAEAQAFVFDALDQPIGVTEVAAAARTPEQASELYLVSRLAVDPDHPAERAYLAALAHRLKLAPDLVQHLDRQVDAAG